MTPIVQSSTEHPTWICRHERRLGCRASTARQPVTTLNKGESITQIYRQQKTSTPSSAEISMLSLSSMSLRTHAPTSQSSWILCGAYLPLFPPPPSPFFESLIWASWPLSAVLYSNIAFLDHGWFPTSSSESRCSSRSSFCKVLLLSVGLFTFSRISAMRLSYSYSFSSSRLSILSVLTPWRLLFSVFEFYPKRHGPSVVLLNPKMMIRCLHRQHVESHRLLLGRISTEPFAPRILSRASRLFSGYPLAVDVPFVLRDLWIWRPISCCYSTGSRRS